MAIATVIRFPAVEHFYMLVFLLTLTAFYKGVRSWEEDREEIPWHTHAWSGKGIPWILTCAISLVQILRLLARSRMIPYRVMEQLEEPWPVVVYIVLGLAMLLFASFSRLLLVWLGFEWRRRQG